MTGVLECVLPILFLIFSLFEVYLFNRFFYALLKKKGMWFSFLLLWSATIILEVFLYSWLPGRFGLEMTLDDFDLVLKDGAIISNLGVIMGVQLITGTLCLIKYIWDAIRKRVKFSIGEFVLQIVCLVLFGIIADKTMDNPYVADFYGQENMAVIGLIIMIIAAVLIVRFFIKSRDALAKAD